MATEISFGSTPVIARGNGRVGISIRRPPTPRPVISSAVGHSPAKIRFRTQSKPFSFGLRAQPGAPITGTIADLAEHQQIAGIDRHADLINVAAREPNRRGNDVVGVGDSRRAKDDNHFELIRALGNRCRDSFGSMRHALLLHQVARRQPQSRLEIMARLVHHAGLQRRQLGCDAATRRAANGLTLKACSARRSAAASSTYLPATASGMILIVATMSPERTGT